jgi:hypothetical protein
MTMSPLLEHLVVVVVTGIVYVAGHWLCWRWTRGRASAA